MVRAHKVKGVKRTRKEANCDREDVEESIEVEAEVRKGAHVVEVGLQGGIKEEEEAVDEFPGLPVALSEPTSKPGAIFVLEKASLEVGKIGKTFQILNSDDHSNFLRRHGKNPADYRPDIVYQALLAILDSPLNKAGRVRAVYVRTLKGVLFEVKPHVRIPRTSKRFYGIMLQLLQKLSVSASGKREKLLRTIKNPVTQYFPANSCKIGFSYSSEKSVELKGYLGSMSSDETPVFVVGAMSHGKIDRDYTDDYLSISDYPLSAAWCLMSICKDLQQTWKIF